ncbi:MAG: hypothetical protein ACNA7G_12585 [Methylobacter sp.]
MKQKRYPFILKRAVGVCCGPFVLSNVEAWTAHNILTLWVNEKSRSPFDKLRTNGIFHSPTAIFRFMNTGPMLISCGTKLGK